MLDPDRMIDWLNNEITVAREALLNDGEPKTAKRPKAVGLDEVSCV